MKLAYLWAAAVLANCFAGPIVSGGDPSDRALPVGGSGYRTAVGEGDTQIPVIVVRGTPYEMGRHVGRLTRDQIQKFIPTAMARLKPALGVSDQAIQDAWARTAAYSDDRFEQELIGLSDGSGMPLSTLQAVHTLPLLMPYSCSSIWGTALKLWISYAKGDREAFLRPYTLIDLEKLASDKDGTPDVQRVGN